MAKEKNGITLIRLLIAAAVLLVAIASAFTIVQAKASNNEKNAVELKEDGCVPSRSNTTKIAVIEATMEDVREDVKAIGTEQAVQRQIQTTRHIELLEEIRKK